MLNEVIVSVEKIGKCQYYISPNIGIVSAIISFTN